MSKKNLTPEQREKQNEYRRKYEAKRRLLLTPEEKEAKRIRARVYDRKERAKPSRQKYMKDYMDVYTKTPEYKEKDNARYGVERRQQAVNNLRKRKYKASIEFVKSLRIIQDGKCAVCGRVFDLTKTHGECLDHCHETNQIRGLLCLMCNTFEGFIKKRGLSPTEYAERLERYLTDPPARIAELV